MWNAGSSRRVDSYEIEHTDSTRQFIYTAFGLNIYSTIECPELIEAYLDATRDPIAPEVTIKEIYVWDPGFPEIDPTTWFTVVGGALCFRINEVGYFRVSKGSLIEFMRDRNVPPGTVQDRDLRVFLLGSCLGAISLQLGRLPLHASAASLRQGLVAFVGHSGAGKSTTLGACLSRGYPMMTDDVCVLDFNPGRPPVALPAYPNCKFDDNSAKLLGIDFSDLHWINRFKSKKYLSCPEQFDNISKPLSCVVELSRTAGSEATTKVSFVELSGAEKMKTLYQNLYRTEFFASMGILKPIFKQLSLLAKQTRVIRVNRTVSSDIHPQQLVEEIQLYLNDPLNFTDYH